MVRRWEQLATRLGVWGLFMLAHHCSSGRTYTQHVLGCCLLLVLQDTLELLASVARQVRYEAAHFSCCARVAKDFHSRISFSRMRENALPASISASALVLSRGPSCMICRCSVTTPCRVLSSVSRAGCWRSPVRCYSLAPGAAPPSRSRGLRRGLRFGG